MNSERGRLTIFMVGGVLILAAVASRVWLAASGGYNLGGPYPFIRAASTIALVAGFLLAGAATVWPRKRRAGAGEESPRPQASADSSPGKPRQ